MKSGVDLLEVHRDVLRRYEVEIEELRREGQTYTLELFEDAAAHRRRLIEELEAEGRGEAGDIGCE